MRACALIRQENTQEEARAGALGGLLGRTQHNSPVASGSLSLHLSQVRPLCPPKVHPPHTEAVFFDILSQ